MSYPEGLYLTISPSDEPAIFDAQDVCWIEFTDGGHGDPTEWQANIVLDTCRALGVESAYDENGNERSIVEFLENYIGDVPFYN